MIYHDVHDTSDVPDIHDVPDIGDISDVSNHTCLGPQAVLVSLLTEKEVAIARGLFLSCDHNGDGVITHIEAKRMEQKIMHQGGLRKISEDRLKTIFYLLFYYFLLLMS